jgi:hypothetical protein
MATDRSRDQYQGLAVVDPRMTSTAALWSAESSYTQAGPLPGDPAPDQSTHLVLRSSGTQSASKDLRVRCQRGGMPLGREHAGTFSWKEAADTNWRGWIPPNTPTLWQPIVWTDGSGLIVSTANPQIVALPNGKAVLVYEDQTNGGAYRVRTTTQATDGTWGTAVTVYSSTAPLSGFFPCLAVLPDGSVRLWHWLSSGLTAASSALDLACYTSGDDGATWASISTDCLPVASRVTNLVYNTAAGSAGGVSAVGRLRAVYINGAISLVAQATVADTAASGSRDIYLQYASVDDGSSFTEVAVNATTDSGAGKYHDLAVHKGKLHAVMGRHGAQQVESVVVASAFSDVITVSGTVISSPTVSDTPVLTVAGLLVTDGDVALTSTDSGILVLYSRRSAVTYATQGWATDDDWSQQWVLADLGGIVSNATAGDYLTNMAACFSRGRAVLAHQWVASTGNEDNSIATLDLGGGSTVTPPDPAVDFTDDFLWRRGLYNVCWLQIELPSDAGWTAAGTGTGALAAGYANITTTGAQTLTYARTPAAAGELAVFFQVKIDSGATILTNATALRLRLANGTYDFDVTVRVGGSNLRIVDQNNSSATVGSDAVIDSSADVQVLVVLDSSGNVSSWTRPAGSDASDMDWTDGPTGTVTDDSGSPDTTNEVDFGCHLNAATDQDWRMVAYSEGTKWAGLADGQTNPDDLTGRPFYVEPVYVDDGVKIQATDGPAESGQTWKIETRYSSPVENLLPYIESSPAISWSSTSTAENTIALAYDATLLGTAESNPGSDLLAFPIFGANFKTATIQREDTGSGWVDVASVDMASGFTGLAYTRQGNAVVPNGTSSVLLKSGEMDGWIADLGGGKLRKVRFTTGGKWSNAFAGATARLVLEDIDGTEGASGTLDLYAPNAVVLVNMLGETACGWRLKVPNQSTVNGSAFTCSLWSPMMVRVFPQAYSWGRRIEQNANTSMTTRLDGTRRARRLGDVRRMVEFSWADGIDTSQVFDSSPDPDYVRTSTTSGAEAAGSIADTAYLVEAIHELVDGDYRPVLYLPRIAKSTSSPTDVVVLNRPDDFMWGRAVSGIRREVILGDEGVDELVRVNRIRIEEEL